MLPDAIAFALLGAIESLLSAVVADGMTGRRHRSNCELVAQGFANIGSALFGGICVTGTIARTATNVRAGAHGPVSGMLHSRLPARLHAGGRAARQLHPARRARRRAGGRRLEHGREARPSRALLRSSRGDAAGAAGDLRARRLPRPDRRHRRRLRARLDAVHRPHGEDDRGRGRPAAGRRTMSPTAAMATAAYDAGDGERSRYRRLPHLRRLLLRRRLDRRRRARPHRRPAQELHPRLFGRAVPRFDRGQCHRGRGAQGGAGRRALLHRRRFAADTAHAVHPRRQAAAGDFCRIDQGCAGATQSRARW